MFYVYEWFNAKTKEVFYVGKGCRGRYKSIKNRNNLFIEYYQNNNCECRIIKTYDNEQDALKAENELILFYKSQGQCKCNLDNGGTGGLNFIWTDEMRKNKSLNNPMKLKNQRERMSKKNPMKNDNIKKIVGEKHKKSIVLNGVRYNGIIDASKKLNITTNTIMNWCKRGYDTNGNPCKYENEQQKEYIFSKTSSKEVIIDEMKFKSLREAADFLGVKDTSPLCRALKRNKTYKGHTCKYGNQQPSQAKSSKSNLEGSTTNE